MTSEEELQDRVQAWMGTGMMITGSLFAILIFADRMDIPLIRLPSVWYSSRQFHLVVCGAMFLAAAILLKSPLVKPVDTRPLFRTCRLMTRRNCHLCDEAMAVLVDQQESLPVIEVIDVDDDPALASRFGESVPVVEIDGKIRFRGAVNPVLLQRLIDAARLRSSEPGSEP